MGPNTQSFLFTSSGLLSQAAGPGGVAFAKPSSQTDQPQQKRRIRLYNIRAVFGGIGSVQVFDSLTSSPAATDEVWGSIATVATGNVDSASDVGVVCNSGDVYVQLTGTTKVYLYVDKDF